MKTGETDTAAVGTNQSIGKVAPYRGPGNNRRCNPRFYPVNETLVVVLSAVRLAIQEHFFCKIPHFH